MSRAEEVIAGANDLSSQTSEFATNNLEGLGHLLDLDADGVAEVMADALAAVIARTLKRSTPQPIYDAVLTGIEIGIAAERTRAGAGS